MSGIVLQFAGVGAAAAAVATVPVEATAGEPQASRPLVDLARERFANHVGQAAPTSHFLLDDDRDALLEVHTAYESNPGAATFGRLTAATWNGLSRHYASEHLNWRKLQRPKNAHTLQGLAQKQRWGLARAIGETLPDWRVATDVLASDPNIPIPLPFAGPVGYRDWLPLLVDGFFPVPLFLGAVVSSAGAIHPFRATLDELALACQMAGTDLSQRMAHAKLLMEIQRQTQGLPDADSISAHFAAVWTEDFINLIFHEPQMDRPNYITGQNMIDIISGLLHHSVQRRLKQTAGRNQDPRSSIEMCEQTHELLQVAEALILYYERMYVPQVAKSRSQVRFFSLPHPHIKAQMRPTVKRALARIAEEKSKLLISIEQVLYHVIRPWMEATEHRTIRSEEQREIAATFREYSELLDRCQALFDRMEQNGDPTSVHHRQQSPPETYFFATESESDVPHDLNLVLFHVLRQETRKIQKTRQRVGQRLSVSP